MKKIVLLTAAAVLLTAAGCNTIAEQSETSVISEISVQSTAESSLVSEEKTQENNIPGLTEYDELDTAEYTGEDLKRFNGYSDDFYILYDSNNEVTIDGFISNKPIHNESDAMEQITAIRSLLRLINPEQQLVYSSNSGNKELYRFKQYYGGIQLYSSSVSVHIDTDTNMCHYLSCNIVPYQTLKKIDMEPDVSEEDIYQMYADRISGLHIKEMVIWDMDDYCYSPVLAYKAETDDEIYILNADSGEIIQDWTTIMT